MKSRRVRGAFDWELGPDDGPVSLASESAVAPSSADEDPPSTSGVGRPRGEGTAIVSRARLRGTLSQSFQGDVRISLSRRARSLLAGVVVFAFCIGWSWGASVGSIQAAATQAPATPYLVAVGDAATRFEREVLQ